MIKGRAERVWTASLALLVKDIKTNLLGSSDFLIPVASLSRYSTALIFLVSWSSSLNFTITAFPSTCQKPSRKTYSVSACPPLHSQAFLRSLGGSFYDSMTLDFQRSAKAASCSWVVFGLKWSLSTLTAKHRMESSGSNSLSGSMHHVRLFLPTHESLWSKFTLKSYCFGHSGLDDSWAVHESSLLLVLCRILSFLFFPQWC